MTPAERRHWAQKASTYTRDDYIERMPDTLLDALAQAPIVNERLIKASACLHRRDPSGEIKPSELRVAGMVASGYRNHEIASQLGMSMETVKDHVKHLLAKLDLPSRYALTAVVWAARSRGS